MKPGSLHDIIVFLNHWRLCLRINEVREWCVCVSDCVCVCVCVREWCVCERERERERASLQKALAHQGNVTHCRSKPHPCTSTQGRLYAGAELSLPLSG